MILEQSALASILSFKMRIKFFTYDFTAINILCKFGEDIFINEGDIKVNVKIASEMPVPHSLGKYF